MRMRKIILAGSAAIALLSSLTASFAQAPAPVPALPDAERRTSYSISASLCSCNVGFALFGDSTDVVNWLEVFVNGVMVPQSGGWTLSSPSGPLANLSRPITDAVLTFTTAQTGIVQIVGARRPRRTTQFQESQPVPTRNFNQTFSDIIATQRELWDKTNDFTGRGVFAPPGETLKLLPVLASRQNMGACFDSGGNLTSCVAASSGTFAAGSGIVFTGTNPTTISAPVVPVNVILLPQGRLTLTSGVAVTKTDVVGATFVFYTFAIGNQVPIAGISTVFAELSNDATQSATGKAGPAAVAPNSIYDFLVWSDAGTVRLTRSPAWASDISQGTGAGTAERVLSADGELHNKFAVTNGPGAGLGTIVGSARSDASSQFKDTIAFRWLSNIYNVAPRQLQRFETAGSWAYTTAFYRQANANVANQLDFLMAVDGQQLVADVVATYSNTTVSTYGLVGIDIDTINTTTVSGNLASINYVQLANAFAGSLAKYNGFPGMGRHIAIWKELSSAVGAGTFYGVNASLQSGLQGTIWN